MLQTMKLQTWHRFYYFCRRTLQSNLMYQWRSYERGKQSWVYVEQHVEHAPS